MDFTLHLDIEEAHEIYDLIDEFLERNEGMLNDPVAAGLNADDEQHLSERVTNLHSVLSKIRGVFTNRLILLQTQEAIQAQAARNFAEGRANPRRNMRKRKTRKTRRS